MGIDVTKVNLRDIADAMDWHSELGQHYLNIQTGEVVYVGFLTRM